MLADRGTQCAGVRSASDVAIPRIAISTAALRRPISQRLIAARRNSVQAHADTPWSLAIQMEEAVEPIPSKR
jgi:hypothetical protein